MIAAIVGAGAAAFLAVVLVAGIIVLRGFNKPVYPKPYPFAVTPPPVQPAASADTPSSSPQPNAPVPPLPSPSPATEAVASTPQPASSGSAASPTTTPSAPANTPMPVVTPASSTPTSSGPELVYKFKPGIMYPYHFTVEGNIRGSKYEYGGMVTYVPEANSELATQAMAAVAKGEGSGTAFVVHSDGLLITCEHVVRDAARIEVTVNGRTLPARVLSANRERDIAILKVDARGLQAIALGDSDQVQLAEEVRAVGFPLSDVLGTSLKITRGTVSGFVERRGKLLQIDASINPGNSGGPLVNARGEVVGVCSSGLVGDAISNVGFAVPSSEVRRLLESKGYKAQGTVSSTKLDGPELARQVTPAVAFVKVSMGTDPKTSLVVAYNGFSYSRSALMQSHEHVNGQAIVSRQGEMLAPGDDSPLPLQVSSFASLAFDKLPEAGETTWQVSRESHIVLTSRSEDQGYYRSPYRPNRRERLNATVLPIAEKVSYRLGEKKGDIQILHKVYELGTVQKEDELPVLQITGKGTVSFDTKLGYPTASEMELQVTQSRDGVSVRLPVGYKYSLGKVQNHAEYLAEIKAKSQENQAKQAASTTTPGSAPTSSPMPVKEDDRAKVRGYLDALASKTLNASATHTKLAEISFVTPIPDMRDEVSKALDPFLTSKDSVSRSYSMNGVKKWGTKHNLPTLLKLLDSLDDSSRREAMECLALYSEDPAHAQKIASLLLESSDRYSAQQALKKMKTLAEDAVLPLLANEDEEVRSSVCDVLRETGTEKSVAPLEKLSQNKASSAVRSRAESALREIKRRLDKAK